jgi:hypothetical protein
VSDYRKSYDAKLAAINSAIESMPGSLDQHLPGFTKPKLKRFFQRFSLLLGRLDKSGAKQPQYLYWGSNPQWGWHVRLDEYASAGTTPGSP